jgi:hypothetical protein
VPDEPIVREKAREAIQSGRVPTVPPSRMFCRLSEGVTCALCGDPLPGGEMAFELEFQNSPPPKEKSLMERLNWIPEVRSYHLHHNCFVAWEFERTKVPGVWSRS